MIRLRTRWTHLAFGVALLAAGARVEAQGLPARITVDEAGNGALAFPGSPLIPLTGVLTRDPGPGGLALALTFDLLGPPSLVAGDLILLEAGGGISDVIRFNPAGTGGASYVASLVFYSDLDGGGALADVGFPSAFYANTVRVPEMGLPGGATGFVYTPLQGQPGYVDGFSTTYEIISDFAAVPEPATVALLATGLVGLTLVARRRRA